MGSTVLENILEQGSSLRALALHHFGRGLDAMLHAAALIQDSEHVVFTGMGASFFACLAMPYLFSDRAAAVSVVESSELLYFLSGLLRRKTTVIVVSRSGESIEVTKLLPLLQQRGCTLISATNVPGSTVASCAAEDILINSPSDKSIAIQTYTATVAVLALLAAASLGELETAKAELDATIQAAEHLLRSGLPEQTQFPFRREPIYFLGRGSSLATVNAAVLLMHEMAKLPAIGMSSAQFRHGPVEVVNKDFQTIIFGSQPATADIDLKLARDLAHIGATVGWIGPSSVDGTIHSLCSWPDHVPARFAPIVEVIPAQMLSLRLAESAGIEPGKFRYLAQVTLSETGFAGM